MKPLDIFLAILVPAFWGGNFVAAKFGLSYFPPFFLTALRFLCVSLVLLPFVPHPPRDQWKPIFILSTMSTLHFSLVFVALFKGLDIAGCALIGQIGVPVACLLGAVFLNDRLGLWRITGIVIAFIGTAIVSGTPNVLEHMPGFYALLGATIAWGIATILIKRVHGVGNMAMLAWVGLFNIPMLFALSYVYEYSAWPSLAQAPLPAVLGVAYTCICSTMLAYGIWYHLLAKHPVSLVAPYTLLTPVFGIGAGEWFFHERLSADVMAGGIVTILGVAMIVIRRPKTAILGEAT